MPPSWYEIHGPRPAAKLAVGDGLQTDLLVQGDRTADGVVLDGAQRSGVDVAGKMLGTGVRQLRRAQQAADVIGAKRGDCSGCHGAGDASDARSAPSLSEWSLAQQMSGSTAP
jgi:hypothetical protein